MTTVPGAPAYRNPGDLCAVTCLFNLGGGEVKIANYHLFRRPFVAGCLPLVTVECAFGEEPWRIPESDSVIHLRTQSRMWQKEKLLNYAMAQLSESYSKFAWIDADVLFANPDWALEASAMLEESAVVQLAESVIRLPEGARSYCGEGAVLQTFGSVYRLWPNALLSGDFGTHGHTGFGWAARRDVLMRGASRGLYDGAIAGGGDHIMAHAFCGDWESSCLTGMMGEDSVWHRHAAAWAQEIYPAVRARVGVVPGSMLHLYHGEIASRRHGYRYRALHNHAFDPTADLVPGPCWEWRGTKPALEEALSLYMATRQRETH